MPNISINIPDGEIADTLLQCADEFLLAKEIDIATLSPAQRSKKYLSLILRDVYFNKKRNTLEQVANDTVSTSLSTATDAAKGIS